MIPKSVDFCYIHGSRDAVLRFIEQRERELGTLHVRTRKSETDYELERTLFSTHKVEARNTHYWRVRIHTRSIELMRRAKTCFTGVDIRPQDPIRSPVWIWDEEVYRQKLYAEQVSAKKRTLQEGGIPLCTVQAELADVQMWVDMTNYFVKRGIDSEYIDLPEEALFIRVIGSGKVLVLALHSIATYIPTYTRSLQHSNYWVGGAVTWSLAQQNEAV